MEVLDGARQHAVHRTQAENGKTFEVKITSGSREMAKIAGTDLFDGRFPIGWSLAIIGILLFGSIMASWLWPAKPGQRWRTRPMMRRHEGPSMSTSTREPDT